MTLVENVFKRTKEERSRIPFLSISRECRVQLDEVEHLVMKGLSLGLLKGKINEVESVVFVSWVQPRVLDMQQVKTLEKQLDAWTCKVQAKVVSLEQEEGAQELFV